MSQSSRSVQTGYVKFPKPGRGGWEETGDGTYVLAVVPLKPFKTAARFQVCGIATSPILPILTQPDCILNRGALKRYWPGLKLERRFRKECLSKTGLNPIEYQGHEAMINWLRRYGDYHGQYMSEADLVQKTGIPEELGASLWKVVASKLMMSNLLASRFQKSVDFFAVIVMGASNRTYDNAATGASFICRRSDLTRKGKRLLGLLDALYGVKVRLLTLIDT